MVNPLQVDQQINQSHSNEKKSKFTLDNWQYNNHIR